MSGSKLPSARGDQKEEESSSTLENFALEELPTRMILID
jgi:hypothetical protein